MNTILKEVNEATTPSDEMETEISDSNGDDSGDQNVSSSTPAPSNETIEEYEDDYTMASTAIPGLMS